MYIFKFLISFLLFGLFHLNVSAQTDIYTDISNRNWFDSDGKRLSVAAVEITDLITYVYVEVEATKKHKELIVTPSRTTKLVAGNKSLPILGWVDTKNKIHKLSYDTDLSLSQVKKGDKRIFAFAFSGRPNPGTTTISYIDPNPKNLTDKNIRINNPTESNFRNWTPTELEKVYKESYIDRNKDEFQGIYKNGNLKVALIKVSTDDWRLLYISGDRGSHWNSSDCVAQFKSKNGSSFSNGTYVWPDKLTTSCTAQMDGDNLRLFFNHTDKLLLREYPTPTKTYISPYQRPDGKLWTGTGWALRDNYVVTNYHVIEGARTISVKGINGNFNISYFASVVATDKQNDLAILKLSNVNISNIPYAVITTTAEVGQDVFVLGYPMTQTMGYEIKLTNGIISSLSGFQDDVNNYQISAPIQPGNSGGPMFDNNGNVIGVVVAKHTEAELASYAIKILCLENLLRKSIGTTVLPQNNQISNLPLTEKVKELKKFVFYIQCSDTPDYNFQ